MLSKKEINKAFQEGTISEDKYKEELFKIETKPKQKRKRRKLPTFLTPEEFNLLIKNTKQYNTKIIFLLSFGSGMRISEILGGLRIDGGTIHPLHRNNIDLDQKKIFIDDAKGGKQRVVPLPKGFKQKMLSYFPLNKKYKNIKSARRSVQRQFKVAAKKAKLLEKKPNLHFHSLRHSFGTRLANQGVPLHQIALLMGHSNVSTTNIYTIADPKDALQAYEENF